MPEVPEQLCKKLVQKQWGDNTRDGFSKEVHNVIKKYLEARIKATFIHRLIYLFTGRIL
jgi:hypothetical protein